MTPEGLNYCSAQRLEAESTGVFFFDVEDVASPPSAMIDVTGVDDATGNELMYFEMEMDKSKGDAAKP